MPAANWYQDPKDPARERYWDGSGWTTMVRTPDVEAAAAPQPPNGQGTQHPPAPVAPQVEGEGPSLLRRILVPTLVAVVAFAAGMLVAGVLPSGEQAQDELTADADVEDDGAADAGEDTADVGQGPPAVCADALAALAELEASFADAVVQGPYDRLVESAAGTVDPAVAPQLAAWLEELSSLIGEVAGLAGEAGADTLAGAIGEYEPAQVDEALRSMNEASVLAADTAAAIVADPEGDHALLITAMVDLINSDQLFPAAVDQSLAQACEGVEPATRQPDQPGGPDAPGMPGEPGLPDEPSLPGEPGLPDEPSLPGEPGLPDEPSLPGEPGLPDEPENFDGIGGV